MSQKHQILKKAAKKAIDDLFADTSVSQDETREALEELSADIQSLLDSIPSEE